MEWSGSGQFWGWGSDRHGQNYRVSWRVGGILLTHQSATRLGLVCCPTGQRPMGAVSMTHRPANRRVPFCRPVGEGFEEPPVRNPTGTISSTSCYGGSLSSQSRGVCDPVQFGDGYLCGRYHVARVQPGAAVSWHAETAEPAAIGAWT